jgi:hypothetical protein
LGRVVQREKQLQICECAVNAKRLG